MDKNNGRKKAKLLNKLIVAIKLVILKTIILDQIWLNQYYNKLQKM